MADDEKKYLVQPLLRWSTDRADPSGASELETTPVPWIFGLDPRLSLPN